MVKDGTGREYQFELFSSIALLGGKDKLAIESKLE